SRAVEARLSDALHGRLTERFVNRRTSVLMRRTGPDAGLLPVELEGDELVVDGEKLGKLDGFRFAVDPSAHHSDHKLLFAAAERHLPQLLGERATGLAGEIAQGSAGLAVDHGVLVRGSEVLARLKRGKGLFAPQLVLDAGLEAIPDAERRLLREALEGWLAAWLAGAAPLAALDAASRKPEGGPELRAMLIRLVDGGGVIPREGSGLDQFQPGQRDALRKLGVRIGAIDLFVPAALKPGPLAVWRELAKLRGLHTGILLDQMPPVVPLAHGKAALGYRRVGQQAIRIDMAEKLLREAHGWRAAAGKGMFTVDPALARSMGFAVESHVQLLRVAGFLAYAPQALAEGAFGPPAPTNWRWRPPRPRQAAAAEPTAGGRPAKGRRPDKSAPEPKAAPAAAGAFAALAALRF
ncbi:MAG TPA: helicase, partial [Novosphingobium sp.]